MSWTASPARRSRTRATAGAYLSKRYAKLATSPRGRWPDLSVLLDIPLEMAQARRATQHAQIPGVRPDRIEAEDREFHSWVTAGFREIAAADGEHWVVVDGSRPEAEVASAVLAAVRSRLLIEGPS